MARRSTHDLEAQLAKLAERTALHKRKEQAVRVRLAKARKSQERQQCYVLGELALKCGLGHYPLDTLEAAWLLLAKELDDETGRTKKSFSQE